MGKKIVYTVGLKNSIVYTTSYHRDLDWYRYGEFLKRLSALTTYEV